MFTPNTKENQQEMLKVIGAQTLEDLFKDIPQDLMNPQYNLPAALSEAALTREVKALAAKNKPMLNFAGAGIYEHFIPAAVNALSSRGEFLTAYTPYQAEASQGTLQVIYEYQSCMCALYGMDASNASHYDGATALAEACGAAARIKGKNKILLACAVNPQYVKVLKTYFGFGNNINFEFVNTKDGITDLADLEAKLTGDVAAFVLQTPNFLGCIEDGDAVSQIVKAKGALLIVSANPLSLGALKAPGAYGADFAVGEGQPLGNAMAFGGPGLGIFTCKKEHIRHIPGRICGIAKDADGKRAFVLTLQAREQHIRRERASSNICSNQALCALNAVIYLTLLGPAGLKEAAELNIENAHILQQKICAVPGYGLAAQAPFFNEFLIRCPVPAAKVIKALAKKGITAGYDYGKVCKECKDLLLVCATETKTAADIEAYISALGGI
ncbi:MAG: aminomethyl-transferring glycine dehydrogenase subunit GcvPA [Elusimicrobiota bacterium]|jgi:glycine dehydrogenase subunit 1|nr:aminomethyl-transferring glycine dehydrogenase subunit GcvPA [Elusimicrobiota bacterium]